ncbi:hypothetical protein [Streptomyces sp. NPDC008139]|uniref:hypothetical protein n=1 Tax=Streptomyces sp. NPDC008139 TaxID=3364814 RepID=UPI0036DFD1D8
MARWMVLISPVGGSPHGPYRVDTLTEFEASHEEAPGVFLNLVNTFDRDVRKPRRRQAFKCSERTYVLRVEGYMKQFEYRFELAELVADTAAPHLPDTIQ